MTSGRTETGYNFMPPILEYPGRQLRIMVKQYYGKVDETVSGLLELMLLSQ